MTPLIIGVGMTPFGKFADQSLSVLAESAARAALADAGLFASDVNFAIFSNAADGLLSGQECIRGEVALQGAALNGIPIVNVENACASGSSAVHLAAMSVRSGQYDVVLVVGAEKMTASDKLDVFKAMSAGTDLVDLPVMRERVGGAPDRTVFMDIYASLARDYMARSGATAEDFAIVATKSRMAASLNDIAQFRKPTTVEAILDSRMVIAPLTLPMCSPIGDGAAAVVVSSPDFARKRGLPGVRILGHAMTTGLVYQPGKNAAFRAAAAAYEMASLGPEDMHVIELHDATASAELSLYEDIGLAGAGEGVALLRSGATGLNGAKAVNSSGGLLCRGHPIGATGCAQIVELTQQLRGQSGPRQREGAMIALAENGGGYMGNDAAVACVTILGR